MLDIDHGTYPFVTSSSPTVGGASTGLGISPRYIQEIAGVYKAYTTRVGSGPFPTELDNEVGDAIRERAQEYGTTTGRARRCGWFDAVVARHSVAINGMTSAILTRLDVLDGFSPKICIAYRFNGEVIDNFPASISVLDQIEPVYENMPAWEQPTAGISDIRDLPENALNYVKRIEHLIGCPISIISTGPSRNETILLHDIL